MSAKLGIVGRHQDISLNSQHLTSSSLQIYKYGSSVKESIRQTRGDMSPFWAGWARRALSLVKPSSSWASDWLDGSVWTNEALPRLPVGRSSLDEVSLLLHNTLAWEAVWAEEDFLFNPLSNISRMSFQSHYDLQQFWQIISGYCMRYCIRRLETCIHYMPLYSLLKHT